MNLTVFNQHHVCFIFLQEGNKQSKKRRASDSDMALKESRTVRQGAVRPRKDVQALEAELQSVNKSFASQEADLLEAEDVLIRSDK